MREGIYVREAICRWNCVSRWSLYKCMFQSYGSLCCLVWPCGSLELNFSSRCSLVDAVIKTGNQRPSSTVTNATLKPAAAWFTNIAYPAVFYLTSSSFWKPFYAKVRQRFSWILLILLIGLFGNGQTDRRTTSIFTVPPLIQPWKPTIRSILRSRIISSFA